MCLRYHFKLGVQLLYRTILEAYLVQQLFFKFFFQCCRLDGHYIFFFLPALLSLNRYFVSLLLCFKTVHFVTLWKTASSKSGILLRAPSLQIILSQSLFFFLHLDRSRSFLISNSCFNHLSLHNPSGALKWYQ